MPKAYSFNFPIHAISKDNEKSFSRRTGRPFTSKRFKDFEKALQAYFLVQRPDGFQPLEGDLRVDLTFTFKSRVHCDMFNLPKSCCDAMNKFIWKDDRQIKKGSIEICYSSEGEGILLQVSELLSENR